MQCSSGYYDEYDFDILYGNLLNIFKQSLSDVPSGKDEYVVIERDKTIKKNQGQLIRLLKNEYGIPICYLYEYIPKIPHITIINEDKINNVGKNGWKESDGKVMNVIKFTGCSKNCNLLGNKMKETFNYKQKYIQYKEKYLKAKPS